MRRIPALLLTAVLFGWGCGPSVDGPGAGDDDDGPGDGPDAGETGEAQRCQKMDILFVVDDSYSMLEEQENLGENFPAFAQVLMDYLVDDDLPLDFRVAVTTTGRDVAWTEVTPPIGPIPETRLPYSELGDDGAMRMACGMGHRWIERDDPDMVDTFACVADVGTDGPGWEMPLYASELALSPPMSNGMNAGFLRDDALLAIVYLTDEDDCSRHDNDFDHLITEPCTTEPVSGWIDFFDDVAGARGRWATAVIAGPNDCESEFGEAAAADRMQDFVAQAGDNAVFASICDGSLAPALEAALDTFTSACESFPPVE
jgi:hypothetical protein